MPCAGKISIRAQPANNLTLEYEDYVTTGAPAIPNNQDDTNIPENINDTVISTTPNTAGWSSGQKPYYDQANNSAHPGIYNLCNATPPSRRVTMRLTRTRSGSIHMCRNLSAQRSPVQGTPASDAANTAAAPAATWFYRQVGTAANSGTGIGFYFRNEAPQRTTFYSTELMQHAYFNAKDRVDTPGDLFVAGLYYPDGTYYCNTGRGCGGSGVTTRYRTYQPRSPAFPIRERYDPGETTGSNNRVLTEYGNARSYFPSDHGATTATAPWVPCETLHNTAVCGTGTIEVNGFIPGDYTTTNMSLDGYHMRFNTLPGGCEIHMQVAEVDAGYNIRSSEFREYIQEMAPGNRLCRNATKGDGTFDDYNMNNTASGPLNEHIWFLLASWCWKSGWCL
ncbi:MAG: hypothetical protein H6623_05555 [Bdellovibrionaceae bacterium]|nr:hypothetical protein [Pseudobdellovibrionaceae bacterium]